jgi:hypothetical protein
MIAIALGDGMVSVRDPMVDPALRRGRQASGMKFFSYIGTSVPGSQELLPADAAVDPSGALCCDVQVPVHPVRAVAWGLVPRQLKNFRYLAPLVVCAAPTLAMELLAKDHVVDNAAAVRTILADGRVRSWRSLCVRRRDWAGVVSAAMGDRALVDRAVCSSALARDLPWCNAIKRQRRLTTGHARSARPRARHGWRADDVLRSART